MNDNAEDDQVNYTEIEIKKEQEKPLSMRLCSKMTFIRKAAYEEVAEKNLIEKYEESITSFLSDSSPGPLAAALELALNLIQRKRVNDDKASAWARAIIEKSFSCSQLQCQDLSKAVLCDLLSMNYEPVISLIKSNLSSPSAKNTKKVMRYEIILQHLISEFGRNVGFEGIDVIIKGLTAASNPGIRNLANKLMKDIYEWDKENVIANQLLKEKEKEVINNNRKEVIPNRTIIADLSDGWTQPIPNTIQLVNKSDINKVNSLEGDSAYFFSADLMDKLSAKHQKANEKKKLIEDLTSFLIQSPKQITNEAFLNQFLNLFDVLKNFLNENNTNIIIAVIRLLSHLSKHFSHNEHFTSFILDILPKLLDKFNLSNDGINEEVHKLLNDIVAFNVSFDHFLTFIEDISVDDNVNYTINILSFALNQIKANDKLGMKSLSANVIDVLQRLSVDDNELISNLAFNAIELLNMREDNEPVKKDVVKLEVNPEETKMDANEGKGKTFRSMKKKREVFNKSQGDKDVNSNSIIISPVYEDKSNGFIMNNSGNSNKRALKISTASDDRPIRGEQSQLKEEKKEEDVNALFKKPIMIKRNNSLNSNDCVVVGGKSAFNQMFLEEIKQANEEREKTEIPMMIEQEIKTVSSLKKRKKEANHSSSQGLLHSPFIQNEELPEREDKPAQNDKQQETKEQALLSFEQKMELALLKEEEKPSSRKQSNDDIINNKKRLSQEEGKFDDIKAVLGEEITLNMDSPKWESKKQAFEDISTFIQTNCLPSGNEEQLFAYLKHKLKSFKETNFNINREAISLFILLFSTKGLVFNANSHLTILNAYYDKLCDSKLKDQTSQLLIALLDIVGVNTVIATLVSKLQKKPNVNLLKEYAVFFSKCVEDYEVNQLPIKELVDLCKTMASNVNPQVRTSSTSLLCVLYKYIGNDIKLLIKDIKESTLKIIEAELDKTPIVAPDTPRKLKGKATHISFDEGLMLEKNKSNELIPRRDISKRITPKMLQDIRDGKWPEKKETCDSIEKIIIEANMRVLPDGLGELFNLIKAKLTDGNKNIVRMVISLLSKLIEATGLGFKPFTKQIALALLPNFADKMQILRDECHLCLEKWVTYTGFDTFACYIPQFVKTENVELRIELLKVIMKNKEAINKQIGESLLKEMVSPLLLCLQDKSSLVRSAAEEMIVFSFQFISLNSYFNGLKHFKPAIENDLRLVLTKLKDDEEAGIITNHESSSSLITSSINTSMKTQVPMTNHATTPSNGINTASRKDISEKKLTTPISEQKKVQSIKVYKKTKQQLSNEDIRAPVTKTLSTTPTHSNKDSLSSLTGPSVSLIKSPNPNKTSTIFHAKKASISKFQVFQLSISVKPSKEKRCEFDRKYKFSLETLTSDSENKLRDQVRGLFTEDYARKLFSDDFKQVVTSLQSLSLSIQKEENSAYLIENLDIILKIIGFKCNLNQNPLMVKALLEFFEILYVKLSPNVFLNDTEANIIVCLLVDKLGVTNSALKEHLQTLIDNYFLLITPGKAMLIALNCALGKTIKIKVELLEILTLMYINQSIDIVNRPFARMLSRFLSINDNAVKGKTIALFKEIYSKMQDELWSLIDINEKERECLEANLYEFQRDEEDEYIVSESDDNGDEDDTDPNNDQKMNKNDLEYHNSSDSSGDNNHQGRTLINLNNNSSLSSNQPLTTFASNYITNANHSMGNQAQSGGVGKETVSPNALLGSNRRIADQSELLGILKNLQSEDIQERVNTIIIIHEFICAKYEDNKELLIQSVDNIVSSFIEAMNTLFANRKVEDIPVKFTKYLATVLCKIATNKELISHISYSVLLKLSEEILSNYLIENLDKIGDNKEGSIIFRSLNSTMLRLLDNCNSSHIITSLLELVKNHRENVLQNKLASLAIQCLIKLNESFDRIIDAIEVDKVLLHFHLILCDMDKMQSDLQMKSQTDQMILRYIKNFINDLVKHKKEEIINDYIKGVKSHPAYDKYILKWIKNVLSSLNIYPQMPSNTQGTSHSSKSNTSLPTAASVISNAKLSSSSVNHCSLHSIPTLNESSKDTQPEKRSGHKTGESIIEDLKSRMLKQKNLTRSNRNFNYSNMNTNDMSNTITELKKKWNDVNKKNKGKINKI